MKSLEASFLNVWMLKALKSNIFQKISYLLNKWKYQNT